MVTTEKFPLIPIILLDYANNVIYNDKIKTVGFRFRAKQLCNEWGNTYTKFNRGFWNCLVNVEPPIDISDVMADYEDFISHDIDILYFAITAEIIDCPIDKREPAVWALIADVLIQSAIHLIVGAHAPYQMDAIKRLDKCAIDLCHELIKDYKRDSQVNMSDVPRIYNSVAALINRTKDFFDRLKKQTENDND